MAAPVEHMEPQEEIVHFPIRSGANIVGTKPVFTSDNKYLLVCSSAIVKVYSILSGECVRELCGHKTLITGIAIHPTNKLKLISCSLDKTVFIWDYADGVLLQELSLKGRLHGIYTYEGVNKAYFLEETSTEGVCNLVSLNLSKKNTTTSELEASKCTCNIRHTGIGAKGSYIATVNNRRLHVITDGKKEGIKHELEKGLKFTCIACHPVNDCIATGCSDGKIYLWYKFYTSRAVKTVLHWHSLAVGDICFSLEGSYLLSGGRECTLIKWHMNSTARDFLPRLGAPIAHVVCSKDNTLYALCHNDNVIQVISSNFLIQQVYQGLTAQMMDVTTLVPMGLRCDPRSRALVVNGRPCHIQFYSVQEDKQLYNLDIVGHNFISPENLKRPLAITEVTHAEFDSKGDWLATTEYWNDGSFTPEIRLKFWRYIEEQQSYELNTTVEMAHSKKITSLNMRPTCISSSQNLNHMAVTSGEDGKFRLWTLIDDSDIYRENVKWNCESVGFYRNILAGETAFSEDGTLLAVVFGDYITLWDPENNLHKETLSHGQEDPVKHVLFGLDGCSQYLVSASSEIMTVWDLITCSVFWSVNLSMVCITRDPRTDLIAAFSSHEDLFVFRPSSPEPVFSHPAVSGCKILSAVFIPHSKKSIYEKTTLSWQSQSELFFINEKQELQSVALESNDKDLKTMRNKVDFEQNLPQTALSQIMKGHTNKSGVKVTKEQLTQLPDQKFLKEIFGSACHVQPPVTSLCTPFLRSVLRKKASQREIKKKNDEDSDDEMEVDSDSNQDENQSDNEMLTQSTESEQDEIQSTTQEVSQSNSQTQTKQSQTCLEMFKVTKKQQKEALSSDIYMSWYFKNS